MASISKRAQKKDELRRRIFDAALVLFRRQGVAQTTIRQIVQMADVGLGTFFNYYSSKEAVLAELGARQMGGVDDLVASPEFATLTTRERIEGVLLFLVRGVQAEPNLSQAVVQAVVRSPELFTGERRRFVALGALLANLLQEGIARGDVSPRCDVAVAAQILVSSYVLLALDWAEGNQSCLLEPMLRAQIDTLWQGLAPYASLATDTTRIP